MQVMHMCEVDFDEGECGSLWKLRLKETEKETERCMEIAQQMLDLHKSGLLKGYE